MTIVLQTMAIILQTMSIVSQTMAIVRQTTTISWQTMLIVCQTTGIVCQTIGFVCNAKRYVKDANALNSFISGNAFRSFRAAFLTILLVSLEKPCATIPVTGVSKKHREAEPLRRCSIPIASAVVQASCRACERCLRSFISCGEF